MPDARRDAVAPATQILVNGSVIPPEAATDLFLLESSDSTEEIGTFTIALNAGDPHSGRVKYVDADLFREGAEVTIKVGVQPPLTELMSGEITGLEPEFPERGPVHLVVRGYERLYRLGHGRKSRSFRSMKDSAIAEEIAGDWQLAADVEDTQVTHPCVFQNNQTDLEFLRERARRLRYELRVVGKTLRFRKPAERAASVASLTFGQDLLRFSPRSSLLGQAGAVRVQGWSADDEQAIHGDAGSGDLTTTLGGRDSGIALASRILAPPRDVVVVDLPDSPEDAEAMARARLNALAFELVAGDGSCIGNPAVTAGAVVDIREVGARFGGTYYVTASTHTVSKRKGYTTRFEVRRSAA